MLQFFFVDLGNIGRVQRVEDAAFVELPCTLIEVEKAGGVGGIEQGVQGVARARPALRQRAEVQCCRLDHVDRGQCLFRIDEVVRLPRQNREAVPARAALDNDASSLFHFIDLQARVRHGKALELGMHHRAVPVVADARDHQLRRQERGQVARHVERRAADHLFGHEIVNQRFPEYHGCHQHAPRRRYHFAL